MAQYAHMSEVDPEWHSVSSFVPVTTVPTDIEQFRKNSTIWRKLSNQGLWPLITDGLTVLDRSFTVDDRVVPLRTYVPHSNSELGEAESHRFPVLVWMYGGGFAIGSLEDDDPLLRAWTVELRISCVAVDYRKAPEHPFPAAYDDSFAALKWTVANADAISADLQKGLIVGGISAGGNLAAAITQRAQKNPAFQCKVTGQVLIIPFIIASEAYPEKYKSELLSYEQNANAPFVNKEMSDFFTGCYAPMHAIACDPGLSPGLAESFEGLPPAYIQVAGLDMLRDEGLLYGRLLREAGVPTKVDAYPGFPHGFHIIFPQLKASRKQADDFKKGIKWLLGGPTSSEQVQAR
ncbi:Alpha/Beta hydrolase protein [Hysterangium stoloniferum]|nr:Alpha/Beta hydrolase protein [Hysterangium stoloniferum]